MLKMVVEEKLVGPLAHPVTLRKLQDTIEMAENLTLDDVARMINWGIPRLITYKGGSHVAVHERISRRSKDESAANIGLTRLAIITEEEGG